MKRPSQVGADFDEYAVKWSKQRYGLEAGYDARGVTIDPSRADQVQRPGDEWGDVGPLREAYRDLVSRFLPGTGLINVLEIGAGGGRSTSVLLDILGDRAGEYHVVDVSATFVQVLVDRITFPVSVHIVDDIDLSELPAEHFDLCLAQSSWSHIGLYDQYRYLRELRRVLRPGAPMYVNGQFLLGVGNDWTWNRFVRRVDQIDRDVHGVYHEFTSFAALAEMLARLEYDIECINTAGFIARRGERLRQGGLPSLSGPIDVPFEPSPHRFLATGEHQRVVLPDGTTHRDEADDPGAVVSGAVTPVIPVRSPVEPEVEPAAVPSKAPTTTPTPASAATAIPADDARHWARTVLKRIPGVRPAVIALRKAVR